MESPDSGWGSMIVTIFLVLGPILIRAIISRIGAGRQTQTRNGLEQLKDSPRTSRVMKFTVTAYCLSALFVWYTSQPDLFTRLRLPITATGDKIRSALVTQRPIEFIPLELQRAYQQRNPKAVDFQKDIRTSHPLFTPELDRVLQRIETFDIRMAYTRLGHSVVASCDWCTTRDDYLVFAAAGLSLGYVALLCIVGVVTEAPGRRKSRKYAVITVIIAILIDGFFTDLVKGTMRNGETTQYYSRAQLCRLALHIVLPILLLLLPHNAPYLTQEAFVNTIQALAALSHVANAQHSTIKHTRYAGLVREASLHSWADMTSRQVDTVLDDQEFRSILDQARPTPNTEAEETPAAERLKEWAGRAVGEVMKDLNEFITGGVGQAEP